MKRRAINLRDEPNADVPYSSAIIASGTFVFVSGHVGYNPETNEVPDGIEAQTRQSLENIKAVLEKAGTTLENVVKVKVYLANVEHFEAMNAVYRQYFPSNRPARATVGAPLVRPNLLIEIEAVALLPDGADV